MAYHCELKELTAQPALSIRLRTAVQDLPQILGNGYGSIVQYLMEHHASPAGPPFVIYYNMDMQDLDVELGFPVSHRIAGKDTIQSSKTPAGKAATCLHIGPYSDLASTYTTLTRWIETNDYEPTWIAYEVYLNDPDETPPEKLQTQIYLFVNPIS